MVRRARLVTGVMGSVVVVFVCAHRAGAADAIPFFTPDPRPVMYGPPLPDPDAPECAANDRACLDQHDARALSDALARHDAEPCASSRNPDACRDAFEMITGTVGMRADPILDDPCSWVVLLDRGTAVIESKRLGLSRRYADRGWKPRTFLGACNLSQLTSLQEASVPLPTWETRKGPRTPPLGRRVSAGQGQSSGMVPAKGSAASTIANQPPGPAPSPPVPAVKPPESSMPPPFVAPAPGRP